jgi:hypothetical protein
MALARDAYLRCRSSRYLIKKYFVAKYQPLPVQLTSFSATWATKNTISITQTIACSSVTLHTDEVEDPQSNDE